MRSNITMNNPYKMPLHLGCASVSPLEPSGHHGLAPLFAHFLLCMMRQLLVNLHRRSGTNFKNMRGMPQHLVYNSSAAVDKNDIPALHLFSTFISL